MKKPLVLFLLIFTSIIYSQTELKKISGLVADNKGLPIPGVTVTFEENNVATDLDGKYAIEVKNCGFFVASGVHPSRVFVQGESVSLNGFLQNARHGQGVAALGDQGHIKIGSAGQASREADWAGCDSEHAVVGCREVAGPR
jgi:hypothetical protein